MSAGYIDKLRLEIKDLKSALAESIGLEEEAQEREKEKNETICSLESQIKTLKERLAAMEGKGDE